MNSHWPQLDLIQPMWLAALLLLPLVLYYARRSLVRFSPWRHRLSLLLRVIVLVALVLVLSDVRVMKPTHRQFVVFAIDRSDSIPEASRGKGNAFIQEALKRVGDDWAVVLPFAREPGTMTDGVEGQNTINSQGTNLAEAIRHAAAAAPPEYVPHIVLLTDGNETEGNAMEAVRAVGIPISTVPLPSPEPEVSVSPVTARPRILLVESEPRLAQHLTSALEADQIAVDVLAPEQFPRSLAELDAYALVILSNIPAAAMSPEQMGHLQTYVRDSGGGLVVIGGDRAFTPGGYRNTMLEELLPVWSEPTKKQEKPSLAIVLVIDCSDSMKGEAIELAKEATRRAVSMLDPKDQVGVLAFAKTSHWVSPLHPCTDKAAVLKQVDTLSTSYFGTDMEPAMDKAYLALNETFADLKHMIVLTDGVSHPGDFEALAARVSQSGITVSTVGVGREVAQPLLEDIATIGKGRFYHCDDMASVPKIFALEAASASRRGIVEKAFFPQVGDLPPGLTELDVHQAPSLLGYVQTKAKPDCRVVLTSESGEPLLAWCPQGRGMAAVFTSDIESRWTAAWIRWPGFARFWSQLVRHVMRKARESHGNQQAHVGDGSDELRIRPTNHALLRSIAQATGGRYNLEPAAVFAPSERAVPRTILMWPYLLAVAAVVYVFDVAVRRLNT